MESLPQAVLQAGAIIVKNLVNNDRQCFYPKEILETWISIAHRNELKSKLSVTDQSQKLTHLFTKIYFID